MDYTEKSEEEIIDWLKTNLSEKRFSHSLGCAECAKELGEKLGLDGEKIYLAGLLHDCAKNFTKERMLEIIDKHLKDVDEEERSNFKTLHAPVSAYIAKVQFNIKDEEILSAIRWHTLGKMDMSDFEKIVFLADKIEPNTRDLKYRDKVLKHIEKKNGLNKAILLCYKETIKSLVKRELKICKTTIDIYNNLLKLI